MFDAPFLFRDACDCHVHVVGPKKHFPLAKHRSYTPMDAPLPALRNYLERLGLDRVVLVQPSFYGTDNRCLLSALAELGATARGVAVVDTDITMAEIDRLHQAGIRGIRLNMASLGSTTTEAIATLLHDTARLCRRNGWHIQLFVHARSIVALAGILRAIDVPLVIDHFGLVNPVDQDSPAVHRLLDLLDGNHVWVKLSAPYRISSSIDDPRIAALADRLSAANPAQVVWASDWPHTPIHNATQVHDDQEMPYRDIDTARLLKLVSHWIPQTDRLRAILVDNPARLYDFPAPTPASS